MIYEISKRVVEKKGHQKGTMGRRRKGSPKFLWPLLCVLTLFVFSFSCATPGSNDFKKALKVDQFMGYWVGHYQSELIAAWGTPTKVVPNEEGENIIIYESLKGSWGEEKDKHIIGGAHYPTAARQEGYAARRIFYVNKEGIIYSWKWSGL